MINNEIREVKRIRHLLNPESASGVKFGVDITYNNEPTPEESEKKAVDIFNRIKPEYRMICFTADNYRVGERTNISVLSFRLMILQSSTPVNLLFFLHPQAREKQELFKAL